MGGPILLTSICFSDQPTSLPTLKQQALITQGKVPTQMASGERAKNVELYLSAFPFQWLG